MNKLMYGQLISSLRLGILLDFKMYVNPFLMSAVVWLPRGNQAIGTCQECLCLDPAQVIGAPQLLLKEHVQIEVNGKFPCVFLCLNTRQQSCVEYHKTRIDFPPIKS